MRRSPGRRAFLRLATLTAALAAAAIVASTALAAGHAAVAQATRLSNQVTVTRDRAGIPHIVASNFTALGYGEGYAFAQDNLCTFANDIVTVEGSRSKYFGPGGLAVNYSAGISSTNLQSDLFWRYVQASGLIQRGSPAARRTGCCRRSARYTPAGSTATTPVCARASCVTPPARASRGCTRSR
jgi:Penicillin amidase